MNEQTVELVASDHPVLRQKAEPVTDIAAQVAPFVERMVALMREKNGIGMAAPQVGISRRFFVSNIAGMKVAINPVIVTHSQTRTSKREGCITRPGFEVYVPRWDTVLLRFVNLSGIVSVKSLSGLEARIAQHEIDHLDGQCIF